MTKDHIAPCQPDTTVGGGCSSSSRPATDLEAQVPGSDWDDWPVGIAEDELNTVTAYALCADAS